MFLNYYGLRENPFGVIADTRFLYLSPTHHNAIDALCHGLNSGQEFLALVAEPGMGKTTVLRRLATQLGARIVFLSLTNAGTRELLGCLLASLGVDSTNRDLLWMHERLNDALRNEARSSHRFVLIIDEAQNLASSTLKTLRLLSNFETPDGKLIQTVLAGQPALADALARPEHEQLRQRLSVVARLEALPPSEVSKYIDHRLRAAGYTGEPLFTSRACRMIANWSGGIPRKINSLCFNALTAGYAADKRQIDTKVVRKAISALDLDGLASEAQGAQRWRPATGLDRAEWIALASSLLLVVALVGAFSYPDTFRRWFSSAAVGTARRDLAEHFPAPSTVPDSRIHPEPAATSLNCRALRHHLSFRPKSPRARQLRARSTLPEVRFQLRPGKNRRQRQRQMPSPRRALTTTRFSPRSNKAKLTCGRESTTRPWLNFKPPLRSIPPAAISSTRSKALAAPKPPKPVSCNSCVLCVCRDEGVALPKAGCSPRNEQCVIIT